MPARSATNPLTLLAGGGSADFRLAFEYQEGAITADTVERLGRELRSVLRAVVSEPDACVADLDLRSDEERAFHEAEWHSTIRSFDENVTTLDLIQAQIAERAASVAVSDSMVAITYGELGQRSDRLALRLRRAGVTPGDLVGIVLDRTVDMVVAIVGAWKCGAGYVPMDPGFPPERLEIMVVDADLATVIASPDVIDGFAAGADEEHPGLFSGLCVIDVTDNDADVAEPGDWVARFRVETVGARPRVRDLHVRLHRATEGRRRRTSECGELPAIDGGSAGSRRVRRGDCRNDAVVRHLGARAAAAADRWCAGRRGRPRGGRRPGTAGDRHEVGNSRGREPRRCGRCSSTRDGPASRISPSCAAARPSLAISAGRSWNRSSSVWNMYGPTETTVWSAVARLDDRDPVGPFFSLGEPIDNTRLYVLDGEHLAPDGVAGELWIGGAGVARGYLTPAELTAERFRPDPFFGVGERMYRTGDLVRRDPDGALCFLGRADGQIKLRGHRIELGEIESVLARHEQVDQAIVVVREFGEGDERLVGYVTRDRSVGDGADVDTAGVRSLARTALPAYMVPATIVEIDRFPLTPNNKVDRNALPNPASGRSQRSSPPDEENSATLTAVLQTYREILGGDRVAADDDFFDLGGHSILATRDVFATAALTRRRRLGANGVREPHTPQSRPGDRRARPGDHTGAGRRTPPGRRAGTNGVAGNVVLARADAVHPSARPIRHVVQPGRCRSRRRPTRSRRPSAGVFSARRATQRAAVDLRLRRRSAPARDSRAI